LHEHKVRVEAEIVAECSAGLLAAIDAAEERNAKLENDYKDLVRKHRLLTASVDQVWLGQSMVNWHLLVLLVLLCVFLAKWLVSGYPAGPGALGVGGIGGIGADGVVTRPHARLFGLLVELTSGVSV
jgi:hypothetical protein